MKLAVEHDEKHIKNIDLLIKSLYEDKVLGELEDDRYTTLMAEYEKEQRELVVSVAEMSKTLESTDQKAVDLRLLLKTLRELTDVNGLTPTIVNSLIDRIEVHNNDKSSGHCYVKVDIYFSAVGMINIPAAEEICAMIEDYERSTTIPLCGIKRGNGATPHGVTPYLHRDYFLMGLPKAILLFVIYKSLYKLELTS